MPLCRYVYRSYDDPASSLWLMSIEIDCEISVAIAGIHVEWQSDSIA